MQVSVLIMNKPTRLGGWAIMNFTHTIDSLSFTTDERGWADCTMELPENTQREEWNDLAARVQGAWLVIRYSGQRIYEGVIMQAQGRTIIAQGVAALYETQLLTRIWSSTMLDEWQTVTKETVAGILTRDAALYDSRKEDGVLSLSLKQGTAYTNLADIGAWVNIMKPQYTNLWTYISIDYEMRLPTNWRFRFGHANADYSSFALATIQTGNNAVQSGSYTLSAYGPKALAEFSIVNSTGATYNNTQKDGYYYVVIKNIRISTAVPPIYAHQVAQDIMNTLAAANPHLANVANQTILATTFDLREFRYDQESPNSIFARLTQLVDTNGTRRVAAIFEDQALWFTPEDFNQRAFSVTVMPELSYSISGNRTRITPRYTNSKGETLLGTTAVDARAEQSLGYSLSEVIDVPTNNASDAAAAATAMLVDKSNLQSVGDVEVSRLYRGGHEVFGGLIRFGDIVEFQGRLTSEGDRRQRVMGTTFMWNRRTGEESVTIVLNRDSIASFEKLLARLDTTG